MDLDVQLAMERERLALGLDRIVAQVMQHPIKGSPHVGATINIILGTLNAAVGYIRGSGSGRPGELQHQWLPRASGGFTSNSGRLYAVVCSDRTAAPDRWTITVYVRARTGAVQSVDRLAAFEGDERAAKLCAEIMLADIRSGAPR